MTVDYKTSVYLPKTDFPMKAGLPRREPEMLAKWEEQNLEGQIREASKDRKKFILHDGPPYANGHLHIGHALNKILKDVINRTRQMLGYNAYYVPGWDCHGLPIEWKIEEKYRKKKKDKDEVPVVEFRQECREFAKGWIEVQKEEFKRLGIMGDWDHPYTTMTNAAEATIAGELGKFLMDGSLYRGAKPVMWSPVEKTALAEAEVEYHDHTSTTIFVRFPVRKTSVPEVEGASIVIWTTTPWTMPGNRAVAYGPDIDYVVVEVTGVSEDSLAVIGEKMIFAEARVSDVAATTGITSHEVKANFKGYVLDGTICKHPFHGKGYDYDVPALSAGFATTDEGTGIVHIAPGHGADDWELGIANDIEIPQTVSEDGTYFEHIPMFAGMHVYKCNGHVADVLQEADALLARGSLVHRYPHSWRSKKPLIFRNTSQWFISMDKHDLRKKALKAIDETRFVPAKGQNRLRGMIEDRPDWCVSRQRAWGVPITVFVNKETGEPLRDQSVIDRVIEIFQAEGSDAWFASDPQRFMGDTYKSEDYEQVTDILDVWFDSGSTHAFVLESDEWDLQSPASLYLEGSDQHRGWFHSSLLESCGTRGRAPYDTVLTHGFVMAEDGQKMSKSLNNSVSPQDVNNQFGADILRLWVVGSDYSEDLRIGPEILKQQADIYRRLRNTLRFILGNLNEFDDAEKIDVVEMPELDRWVLHQIWEMDQKVRTTCDDFQFHMLFNDLHNFCAMDLSAFYLDIRKDSLYCDRADSTRRRASRTVLNELFNCLTKWFAPFICFTAEEVWQTRYPNAGSVHLQMFPDIPDNWRDDALAEKWAKIRSVRRVVTGALEIERAEKRIGSSLQARPVVHTTAGNRALFEDLDAAELFITSGAEFSSDAAPADAFRIEGIDGVAVVPTLSSTDKCPRCYQFPKDIGADPAHPEVCGRCADAFTHHTHSAT